MGRFYLFLLPVPSLQAANGVRLALLHYYRTGGAGLEISLFAFYKSNPCNNPRTPSPINTFGDRFIKGEYKEKIAKKRGGQAGLLGGHAFTPLEMGSGLRYCIIVNKGDAHPLKGTCQVGHGGLEKSLL